MDLPEIAVSKEIDKEIELTRTDGDAFDEDSGDYLGNLTYNVEGADIMDLPPANLSIFVGGFWYIYKMDKKVKAEEGEANGQATS